MFTVYRSLILRLSQFIGLVTAQRLISLHSRRLTGKSARRRRSEGSHAFSHTLVVFLESPIGNPRGIKESTSVTLRAPDTHIVANPRWRRPIMIRRLSAYLIANAMQIGPMAALQMENCFPAQSYFPETT